MSIGRGMDALAEVDWRLASRTARLLDNGWAILQTALSTEFDMAS